MDTLEKIVVSGINELKKDSRDFQFDKIFGTVAPASIPDFDIADGDPIIIDQTSLNDCYGCGPSELNTILQTDQSSIVNYLNERGQPSDVNSRAALALQYGIVTNVGQYTMAALNGTNADMNAQLLAILRYTNGDYFDFMYQAVKTNQIMNIKSTTGGDIRDAMQSLVEYGSLLAKYNPFTYNAGKPTDRTPAQLADWTLWPASLDVLAAKYKIGSYFAPSGPGDAFDNILSAMWINKQNKVKAGVNFGLYYKAAWVNPAGGVIVDDGLPPTAGSIGGHDMIYRGKKTIATVPFIKSQQSWSKKYGDQGIYYFPRSVVNQQYAIFGAFIPSMIPQAKASYYLQNGIMLGDNWLQQALKVVMTGITNLF